MYNQAIMSDQYVFTSKEAQGDGSNPATIMDQPRSKKASCATSKSAAGVSTLATTLLGVYVVCVYMYMATKWITRLTMLFLLTSIAMRAILSSMHAHSALDSQFSMRDGNMEHKRLAYLYVKYTVS